MSLRNNQFAFTLIELLLTILIGIFIFTASLAFYHQLALTREKREQNVYINHAIRQTLDTIANHMNQLVPFYPFMGSNTSITYSILPLPYPDKNNPDAMHAFIQCAIESVETPLVGAAVYLKLRPRQGPPVSLTLPSEVTGDKESSPSSLTKENYKSELLLLTNSMIRFRYWNGNSWQDSWNGPAPPPGIEIRLLSMQGSSILNYYRYIAIPTFISFD